MAESDEFTIWTEKYRPETFDDIVGHEEIVKRVRSLTEQENLPHLLFAGPPGVGKCVAGDTPVLTSQGTVEPMKDVHKEQKDVLSLDESGAITSQSIEYVHEETSKTVNVETQDGASLTVTPEHPFLIQEDGVPTWREAVELEPDMLIAAPNTYTVEDPEAFLPQYDLSTGEREQLAERLGDIAGKNEIDDQSIKELTLLLDDVNKESFSDDVPRQLSFLTDQTSIIQQFSKKRDKWCRAFLTGYIARTATVENQSYHLQTGSEAASVQLTYLLQRLGIRASQENGLRISGRNATQLTTMLDADLPRVDATDQSRVEIAADHVETVMDALGINTYEFTNDIRSSLQGDDLVTESTAKYIYQTVYEKAQSRIQNAVRFLDQCNELEEDERAYTAAPIRQADGADLRRTVLNGHITAFNDLRHGPGQTDFGDIVDNLHLLWRGQGQAYADRLREQGLTYATTSIIDDFNIGLDTVIQSIEQTPIQITKQGGRTVSARLMRHRYAVANTIQRIVTSRIYDQSLLDSLELLKYLSTAQITWDTVTNVESKEEQQVYDLNVSKTHNFIAGNTPLINHNTTMSLAIAKELYGDSWKQNFLELNASDERGIDIVREKVKDFARTQSLGDVPFKIIYLDEADALTSDAQQALRRTMESYTRSCRFILSCNYSSKIIDPIQSRTTVFRFRGLDDDDINTLIDRITEAEDLTVTESGREALLYASNGDLRRLENVLQTSASISDEIDEDTVYSVSSYTDPENVKEILVKATSGSFDEAKSQLLKTMLSQGLSGPDIIQQFQREIWDLDVDESKKLDMIESCGEIEFRLIEGSDEHIQLDALLAIFADKTPK